MDKLFFSKSRILQTFETLLGLVDGISSDGIIDQREVLALRHWVSAHDHIAQRRPFDEIMKVLKKVLADNKVDDGELEDIRFVCNKALTVFRGEHLPGNTSAIQRLHGLASGIAADGKLLPEEWTYLNSWIQSHADLKGSWPYDEIEALVLKHRKMEKMSSAEFEVVIHYLNDFCGFNNNAALSHQLSEPGMAITGISAVCPDIVIEGRTFCVTGNSKKFERDEIASMIAKRGGIFKSGMSKQIDYLIVCADGSPMWTYSCYGRKVEAAVNMRKEGHRILIVHEFDLWDHMEDVA